MGLCFFSLEVRTKLKLSPECSTMSCDCFEMAPHSHPRVQSWLFTLSFFTRKKERRSIEAPSLSLQWRLQPHTGPLSHSHSHLTCSRDFFRVVFFDVLVVAVGCNSFFLKLIRLNIVDC